MRAYASVPVLVTIIAIAACGSDSPPRPRDAASDARDTSARDTGGTGDTAVQADTTAPAAPDAPAALDAYAAADGSAGSTPSDSAAGGFADGTITDGVSAATSPEIAVDSAAADAAGPAIGLDAAAADTAPSTDASDDLGATTLPFLILDPCLTENSYVTGPPTVSFRVTTDKPGYSPPCLKVRRGTGVLFTAVSESFAAHPLEPRMEGSPDNPITLTTVGTSASFYLPAPGFFPYHCMIHQSTMVGVIWVTE
jgi:plastocyanin